VPPAPAVRLSPKATTVELRGGTLVMG